MIALKSAAELELMRRANRIVAEVHEFLAAQIAPGVSTWDLDRLAEERCRALGAEPAFKGYRGFPASLCIAINQEVVHGIPSRRRRLAEGDIIGLDFGAVYQGYHGDAARSHGVGEISDEARRLLASTSRALEEAVLVMRPGGRVGDIGARVQQIVEADGFSVVQEFVGHGIGRQLHEEPQVPNFGKAGTGPRLRPGMVLAVEPMVNAGGWQVQVLDDGWTVETEDGSLSAHFEHSIAVTEAGPEVLDVVV